MSGPMGEGYWAVQIINPDRTDGRRYICRAVDRQGAIKLASWLSGESMDARGFDFCPVAAPVGVSLAWEDGFSEITDADDWRAIMATRH